jgi:hypothetical protein
MGRGDSQEDLIDYHSLETPAVIRNARRGGASVSPASASVGNSPIGSGASHPSTGGGYHHPNYATPSSSMDTLEIPAFLRKQAD